MLEHRNIHDTLYGLAAFVILGNAVLYLDTIPILRWGVSILRVLSVAYAFAVALPRLRFGRFTSMVGLFYLVAGIFTYIHNGAIHDWVSNTLNSMGIALIIYLSMLRSPRQTIIMLARIFDSLICINFILTLLYPSGIFDGSYLLGFNRNSVGPPLFCGLIVHNFAYRLKQRTWFTYLLIGVISIITLIRVGSMTSVVGCVLLLAFSFVPFERLRKAALAIFFVFYILFQAAVVYFQADISSNRHAVFFVEEVLKKDMTFTRRTFVWKDSHELIQKSPITGYGMRDSQWFQQKVVYKSAHNIIYQILIYGGYILLFIFVCIIISSVARAAKYQSILSLYAMYGVCVFFFMMIMESYNLALIFLLLELCYYSSEFSDTETDNL